MDIWRPIKDRRSFLQNEAFKLPLFYLLLAGAFAGWQSFFNVYLDQAGFTSVQIGALNAVFISTSAIVVPFWGMIADRYGNNRIFLVLTIVSGILVLVIGQTNTFHFLLILMFMISVFHQPGGAVMDGMALGFIRKNSKYSYGQFRLWGSAGYAIASLMVGYFARINISLIFLISGGLFYLLSLINLLTLPSKPITNRSLVNFKSFAVFFRNRKLLIFLLIILLYGLAMSPLHQFINLYYTDIGAGNAFIGMVFFIQAAFEIPAFLLGVKLVKRIKPQYVILFSMLISVLRMLLYGFISDPMIAIWLSVFHGITIAFFLIGVVEYVQSKTPDHLRTTGQALIWAFHFGAGVTLGNLLLGYLRDNIGMLSAMHIHASLGFVVLLGASLFFLLNKD